MTATVFLHPSTDAGDPHARPPVDVSRIAQLAFARAGDDSIAAGRHLALLPIESLELDLSDPVQCQFGDYELQELIGEGGMGVVYRARQRSLDREVAIKLLAAGVWASGEFVERFRREAQNAARMQHPNIVPVYEVGDHDGLHFFSMRLIGGPSLATELRREKRLPPQRAAQLLRTIAEAVDYAHRLGVLHLDLKPANVLVDENGIPHVADFGLARRIDTALAADSDEVSGTPSYMAPEQASPRTRRITRATDIWGLGAILYELVTGEPPFLGSSPQDTLKLVVEGALHSPRRHVPDLPRDLEAIILKCMARDVGERYTSARELADDLSRYLEGRAVRARPLNPAQRVARWARREPKLAAMALLAIAAVLLGLAATTQQWRRADTNAALAHEKLWDSRDADALRLTESGDGWKAAPLLLSNLREMESAGARVRAEGVRKRLGIIENNNPRLIDAWPAPGNVAALAFSPDGRQLALSEAANTHLYAVDDGKESFSVPGEYVFEYLRFSADGRTLIIAGAPQKDVVPHPSQLGMRRLDVARGELIAPPAGFTNLAGASYSDDGRFALLINEAGEAQFWTTDPWRPAGTLRAPPPLNGPPSRLISPDGSVIAQDAQAHAVLLVDPHTLAVRARVELGEFGNIAAWAFSHDSHWLALGDAAGAIAIVDCGSLTVRRPTPLPYFPVYSLAFSADDSWLAAAATAGGVFLWSWPDGQLLAPPFSGGGSLGAAPWGEHVALEPARGLVLGSDETDSSALWQVAPTSPADRDDAEPVTARLNARHEWEMEAIAWDPPRGLLAYSADRLVQLQRLPPLALKSGRAARLMPSTLRFDGRHLAEVQGSTVQVVDAGNEQPIGARIEFPQPPDFAELSADGATLIVVVGPTLHAFDAASGARRFAPIALGGSPAFVEPSPDSARVAVAWVRIELDGERIQNAVTLMVDLRSGAVVGGPEQLPGQAHEMTFSDDGRRLIAWNKLELTLRDGTTLAPLPGPLAQFRPNGVANNFDKGMLKVARFNAQGEVEMPFGGPPSKVEFSRHWELRTYAADGSMRSRPLSESVVPQQILPLPDGSTVMAGWQGGMSVVAPDGSGRDLPEPLADSTHFTFAVSADGHWLARQRRNGAALFDLRNNAFIATLRVAIPPPDIVWKLAFSPDGNHLLARSLLGRQIVWDLSSDARAPAAIARELDIRELRPARAGSVLAAVEPGADERAALRANDPGPWPTLAPRSPAPTARELPGGGIPPRAAEAGGDLLDLTPFYTFGLRETLPTIDNGGADFRWLPQGRQRLLGVDFDIRGAIGLHAPLEARFDLRRRVAAIDVLVLSEANVNGAGKDHLADARLDFADGSRATLPIGFARDSNYSFRDPKAPPPSLFAVWGFDARTSAGNSHDLAFVARVPNPHPERPLKALTLTTPGNPVVQAAILAVSIEPVAPAAATVTAQANGG